MTLIVRALPVPGGRAAIDSFAGELRARGEETHRFYSGFGVRREALFLQETKSGPYVIGITDVEDPVPPKADEYAKTDDAFAQWFQSRVLQLTGVDLREQPLGPATEQVYDSTRGAFRPDDALAVRMYPLTRGAEPLREFARELSSRSTEARAFYDGFDVDETWFVQEIDGEPYAIAIASMRGDSDRNAARYGEARDPFATWFKQRVAEVTGVDPNVTPLGPPSEQVFEFRAS
ncbi:MAG TPA: hypothetical protein VND45_14880 [Thermoanaerobaculia bacterium]|jgi:hypothetical protein|nr:hypothetical protein [Thermoanaerobaculia bacterium]